MAFMENYAAKRDNPIAKESVIAPVPNTDSSPQTDTIAQSSKFRTVSVAVDKYNSGNHVRLQANTKGTGTVGKPTAVALESDASVDAATSNPDGSPNHTTPTFR